jgi:hypothetical protein
MRLLKKLPHIENLSIPFPKETDQLCFADLVAQFKKLTTLSFTDQYISTVADGVLRAITDGCPSLQCLEMGFNEFEIQDVEYFLEKKGQQLLSFSVRPYISTIAHTLLTKCVNLECLVYEDCNADLPSTYIQSLSKLSELRNLTHIFYRRSNTKCIQYIQESVIV